MAFFLTTHLVKLNFRELDALQSFRVINLAARLSN